MKIFVPLHFLSIMAFVTSSCDEYYDSKIDQLDMEFIVSCPKRMVTYTGCFIDRNTCKEVDLIVKENIPESLGTSCAKCSPIQRHLGKRYYEELKARYPKDYVLFKEKYDPEGKRIEAFLKAQECY